MRLDIHCERPAVSVIAFPVRLLDEMRETRRRKRVSSGKRKRKRCDASMNIRESQRASRKYNDGNGEEKEEEDCSFEQWEQWGDH
jgi:hypothetical protein